MEALPTKKCITLLLVCFFPAGNIPSERVLTEEDWAVDEVSSPYEKSKRRAEKTAWELVKNLPGEQQENIFVTDVLPSLHLNVNKGSARNVLGGGGGRDAVWSSATSPQLFFDRLQETTENESVLVVCRP